MPPAIDPVYLTAGLELLAMAVHVAIIGSVLLTRRRDPSATLAWILFIVLLPVVGVMAYLVLGRTRMRRSVRQSSRAETRLRDVLSRHQVRRRLLERGGGSVDARTEAQIRLERRTG